MALRNFLSQKIFNWHAYPCQLDAQVSIGSSGSPTLVTSSAASSIPTSRGIKSITRLTTGIYQVQLDDNYSQLLSFSGGFTEIVTGGALNVDASDAALSIGVVYQVVTLGTSTAADFATLGLPAGLTPAVGMVFKAAATGAGTGTGTVKLLASNAASGSLELLGTPKAIDLSLNNQPFVQGNGGGYITFKAVGAVPAGTVAAPTLTMNSYTPAGTNNGATPPIFTGTPAVLTGTNSAPAFTGTAPAATDPSNGSTMYFRLLLSNSKVG